MSFDDLNQLVANRRNKDLADFKTDPRYYPTKTIEKAFLKNPECLEQFEAWVKDVQKLL